MPLPRFAQELARRSVGHPAIRAAAYRAMMRADEIIPFGQALEFDPHTWVIKETEYGFRIWVALAERSISREILLDRYEREEAAFVQATVKRGDRVVDVGANIGFYTGLLGTIVGTAGHVSAIEPLENVANALERTVEENKFSDRVTVHRVALDARSGSVSLRHAPTTINQGAAYLAPASALPPGHVDMAVRAQTLDELVDERACTFIKIDAEGAEPRILIGAERTLQRCKPIVLAELNPSLLDRVGGNTASDLIAYMAARGYVTRSLTSRTPIERYEGTASVNVVFAPCV
jgi:FkbM family methyltransferase